MKEESATPLAQAESALHAIRPTREQRLFDALKIIASYESVKQLHRRAEAGYGLAEDEAVEMAYENAIADARHAIRGMRRPKGANEKRAQKAKTASNTSPSLETTQNIPSSLGKESRGEG